jgi:CheY-like chemotaxis protein
MSNPSKHPVLLVDDDPSIRATRASALLSAGYDVDTATGGFDALLHLKRAVPAR